MDGIPEEQVPTQPRVNSYYGGDASLVRDASSIGSFDTMLKSTDELCGRIRSRSSVGGVTAIAGGVAVVTTATVIPDRVKGYILGAFGAVSISADTLVIRSVDHLPAWTSTLIRFMQFTAVYLLVVIVGDWCKSRNTKENAGGSGSLIRALRIKWWKLIFVIIPGSLVPLLYTCGVNFAPVSNVAGLYAANAIFTPLLGSVLLKERATWALYLTAFLVMVGCILVLLGDFAQSSLIGSALAFAAAVLEAFHLVAIRYLVTTEPDTNVFAVLVYRGVFMCTVMALLPHHLSALSTRDVLLLTIGSSGIVVAHGCFAVATRFVTSAEVSLFTTVEVVLGPLVVFLAVHETPTLISLIGAIIVISAMITHSLWNMYKEMQTAVADRKRKNVVSSNHKRTNSIGSASRRKSVRLEMSSIGTVVERTGDYTKNLNSLTGGQMDVA